MWPNLGHGRYISWKRKNRIGLTERQFPQMRAAVMARSGMLKWCMLAVAFIALFAYHRSNRQSDWQKSFGDTESLQRTSEIQLQEDEVYTGLPTRAENLPLEMPQIDDLSINDMSVDSNTFDTSDTIEDAIATQVETALQFAAEKTADTGQAIDQLEMEFQGIEQEQMTNSNAANGMIVNEFAQQPESLNSIENEITDLESLPNKLPAPENRFVPFAAPMAQQPAPVTGPVRLPDGVQIKVIQHIEYGKSLARRGATFGAQKEFQSALRLVAQAIDYQNNSRELTSRLSSAFMALREADDFYFAQNEYEGIVDVATIGKRHESKILTEEMLATMTPVDAMQAYYNFIQQQFVACGGQTVVAGEALYCLGKLHVVKSKNIAEGSQLDNAKAIVHHRSAIACDSRNYKSANELAVLLAKAGRLPQAKQLLVHSLKIRQIPRAWENLAFIHQQMGEGKLAKLAFTEFQRTLAEPPATQQIQWISPEQFAQQSQPSGAMRTARAPATQQPKSNDKSSIKTMIKKIF